MKTKENRSGFTLIELLVVVAIIGILVSLLFPAISSVRKSARKSAAKADMQSIVNAVDEYYSTYRKLPIHSDKFDPEESDENDWYDDNGELEQIFSILQGENPREETFLEQQEGRPPGIYMDPWSEGTDPDNENNQQYQLIFDHDLDGEIKIKGISNKIKDELVVVKSNGPSREGRFVEEDAWWGGTTTKENADFDGIYSVDI